MSTVNEWGMTVSNMSVLIAYAYWRDKHARAYKCKTSQKLRKTQNYTYLKHGRAGYFQFFPKLSEYHVVSE